MRQTQTARQTHLREGATNRHRIANARRVCAARGEAGAVSRRPGNSGGPRTVRFRYKLHTAGRRLVPWRPCCRSSLKNPSDFPDQVLRICEYFVPEPTCFQRVEAGVEEIPRWLEVGPDRSDRRSVSLRLAKAVCDQVEIRHPDIGSDGEERLRQLLAPTALGRRMALPSTKHRRRAIQPAELLKPLPLRWPQPTQTADVAPFGRVVGRLDGLNDVDSVRKGSGWRRTGSLRRRSLTSIFPRPQDLSIDRV